MKFILVTIAYGLIFVIVELVAKKLHPPQELARKIGHMLAGAGAALLPFVLSFPEIALLGVLFVPAVLLSMRRGWFSSVHGVNRRTYGEVYFPLAIALCALLFPERLLYTYAVLVIGISDALASLLGQKYGRKKYKVKEGQKSYAGSAAFFVSATLIGFLLTVSLPGADPASAGVISVGIALALTYIEARSTKGLDNLYVPLVAGGLLGLARALGLLGN